MIHYVEQLRIEAARRLLAETQQGVEEIAAACGFSSAELMRRVVKNMNNPSFRSPRDKVGGLYHFGRMLDKVRLNIRGELPDE